MLLVLTGDDEQFNYYVDRFHLEKEECIFANTENVSNVSSGLDYIKVGTWYNHKSTNKLVKILERSNATNITEKLREEQRVVETWR